MLALLVAVLLVLVLLACWVLTLLSLPGNWLMVLAAAVYAWLVPAAWPASLGWRTVVVLLVLAVVGEVLELVAGCSAWPGPAAAAAARCWRCAALWPGPWRASSSAPIPVVGSLVAAVLFAALGAMAGAVLGETTAGRGLDASLRIGSWAFAGRLAGTLGKMLVGAVMIAAVLVGMVV